MPAGLDRLRRRAAARVRLPRRRAVPRPAGARLRQRHQRRRDRRPTSRRSRAVISAFRKPRYVIQKVVGGVSSDWQWYTRVRRARAAAAEPRRAGPHAARARAARRRQPGRLRRARAGAATSLIAGLSLCQDYLAQVRAGRIACRPAIAARRGARRHVHRRLARARRRDRLRDRLRRPTSRTWTSGLWRGDLPAHAAPGRARASASSGSSSRRGRTSRCSSCRRAGSSAIWAGDVAAPDAEAMRAALVPAPPLDAHNALATTLSEELGVAPDLLARPELTEPLLFGPMLPPRYRFDGPGAQPEAPRALRRAARRVPARAGRPGRRRGAAPVRPRRGRRSHHSRLPIPLTAALPRMISSATPIARTTMPAMTT